MIHTKDRWSCLKSSEEISNTKFPPLLPSSLIISTIFRCDHCGWTIALICYNLNFPLMKRGTLILASFRQSLAASSLISSEGATIDDDSPFSSRSTSPSNLVSNGVAIFPLIKFLFSTMIEGIFPVVVANPFPLPQAKYVLFTSPATSPSEVIIFILQHSQLQESNRRTEYKIQ